MALIARSSPSTINRCISTLGIKNINPETTKIKKYDLKSARRIISRVKRITIPTHKMHVFYNLKGGTGKTTMTYQLATHLSIIGYKVLTIDCDSQSHLSVLFLFPEDGVFFTLFDVLINSVPAYKTIFNISEGLDIIPSNLSLSRVEVPLSQKSQRENRLLYQIDHIKDYYDYIFFDTNPSINSLNQNVLVCADIINLVCETSPLSLYGMKLLIAEMSNFFQEINRYMNYRIICNKYESTVDISNEVLDYIRINYPYNFYKSVVRKSDEINLATKRKQPISAFCKVNSLAFRDILDLLHEFIKITNNITNLRGK